MLCAVWEAVAIGGRPAWLEREPSSPHAIAKLAGMLDDAVPSLNGQAITFGEFYKLFERTVFPFARPYETDRPLNFQVVHRHPL